MLGILTFLLGCRRSCRRRRYYSAWLTTPSSEAERLSTLLVAIPMLVREERALPIRDSTPVILVTDSSMLTVIQFP